MIKKKIKCEEKKNKKTHFLKKNYNFVTVILKNISKIYNYFIYIGKHTCSTCLTSFHAYTGSLGHSQNLCIFTSSCGNKNKYS
jgi:hypothetical protein